MDTDGLNFFGRLAASPNYHAAFTGHMEAYTSWKTPWVETYDTSRLVDGAKLDDGSALVVDLGGNTGIDISRVLAKHPSLPAGSLVLQDLPEMVAKAKVDPKIVAMAHDFFKPQPVKGSRAYFMHAVLHDWPDSTAKTLLSNIKDAMTKGYSKLLIYEVVVPPTGASINQTTMDINMMTLLSAFERTQEAWTKLLTESDFKIVKFWPDPRQIETVIEAEIA